jgi:predicted Zn-dependent protease
MSSIEDYHQALLAAQGYCELGMFADSLAELESLPKDVQKHAAVVEAKLIILMQAQRWKEALRVGQQLTKLAPDRNIGYIHTAYCLHEIGHTDKARTTLLSGPETLHSEPVFHYNLACYECSLGNHEVARAHLEKSVQLDKKFRDYAKTDPDLAPLHEPS